MKKNVQREKRSNKLALANPGAWQADFWHKYIYFFGLIESNFHIISHRTDVYNSLLTYETSLM